MATASKNYKGNSLIPKAGSKVEWTPELIEEYIKCKNDPIYFAETYFKIVHQEHGLVQMELYDYQKRAVELYNTSSRLLMATARQVGKTSVATVILLHTALFNSFKNIGIVANKKDTAKEILKRVRTAYEYLPPFLKGGVTEWNKESVTFDNGSVIFADATSADAIRGKAIFLLYIDECAHIDNWEEFSASVLPTISSVKSAKIIITSTPNGLNHFYDYYENAKANKSDFKLVEVPWYEVKGRDEAWKQKTLGEMNWNLQKFAQEQEVEFLGSSGTLISGAVLKRLRHLEPIHQDDGLRLYTPVIKDHLYVMVVDVSRGKNMDYSTFHVIDVHTTPFTQACTYRNNTVNATDFAGVIDRIGRHYNNATMLIENNDNGGAVIDMLFNVHEYENMLMTQSNGRGGKILSQGFGKNNAEWGIRTTRSVKLNGCALVKPIIEQNIIDLVDKNTIDEFKTFSAKNNSYEAEEGKHDDMVMPLVLFGWLTKQDYFKQLTDVDVLKNMGEVGEDELQDYLIPFGIVNTMTESYFGDLPTNDPFTIDDSRDEATFDTWMVG